MSEDLKKLGFKCGVEIHQQLLTQKKLFCRCPAGLYTTHSDGSVLRHMRPTLSEMGVYDGCALMEFKTKKNITYLLNKDTTCTYEMDDTPPFPMNQEALDIALELSLMCGCSLVDEIHIARKQYLDGSIPTGFQRTAIVAVDGKIPFEGKEIGVRQISIEEDSCREVEDKGHNMIFRTDRLGMPLIEVVTEPCFESPEEAARGVRHIGRILRASQKVRRGHGATRQDVNVSIEGGTRVEIKGVPRYQLIPDLTYHEGFRQKALLDIQEILRKRNINAETIDMSTKDLSFTLRNTQSPILSQALKDGYQILGVKLTNMEGLLSHPTQPGRTFAHELSGRIRVIACLDDIPNIYHTDTYPEYMRNHVDYKAIKTKLQLTKNDVAILVWGTPQDTQTAAQEILIRIAEACVGIPGETRQHLRSGLTDFERILPGADRMYPDTDHPPIRITPERIQRIQQNIKEAPYQIEARFLEYGLPTDTVASLALSPYVSLIEKLQTQKFPMKLVGRVLGQTRKYLSRKSVPVHHIQDSQWENLIKQLNSKKIQAKYFEAILREFSLNPDKSIENILASSAIQSSPEASSDPCAN